MSTLPPAVRTASLTLLAAGAVVSLSACGVVQSALGSGNQDVMSVGVGDCFNESEMNTALSGEEVTGIPLVDCAESHDSEFFHSEILPEGDYPGEAEITATAEETCQGTAFTDFVGVEWSESEFYAGYLSPIEEGWDAGDREILCYVVADQPVDDTLQDAGR